MLELNFNMAETLAISILVLLLGREIKKRVNFLERFFIPTPSCRRGNIFDTFIDRT